MEIDMVGDLNLFNGRLQSLNFNEFKIFEF